MNDDLDSCRLRGGPSGGGPSGGSRGDDPSGDDPSGDDPSGDGSGGGDPGGGDPGGAGSGGDGSGGDGPGRGDHDGSGSDAEAGRRLAARLGLEPLPDEGGLYRRTHVDDHASAILYLLIAPEFSALHALAGTEIYHWHAGSPLRLLLLRPDGTVAEPVLGPDVAAGQRPQLVVPGGIWQGSRPAAAWSLVGTTMAPPFDWSGFRLGDRVELLARYPGAATRIVELTRRPAP